MDVKIRERCTRTIEKGRRRKKREKALRALRKALLSLMLHALRALLPYVTAGLIFFVTLYAWFVDNERMFGLLCTLSCIAMALLFAFWAPEFLKEDAPAEPKKRR